MFCFLLAWRTTSSPNWNKWAPHLAYQKQASIPEKKSRRSQRKVGDRKPVVHIHQSTPVNVTQDRTVYLSEVIKISLMPWPFLPPSHRNIELLSTDINRAKKIYFLHWRPWKPTSTLTCPLSFSTAHAHSKTALTWQHCTHPNAAVKERGQSVPFLHTITTAYCKRRNRLQVCASGRKPAPIPAFLLSDQSQTTFEILIIANQTTSWITLKRAGAPELQHLVYLAVRDFYLLPMVTAGSWHIVQKQ